MRKKHFRFLTIGAILLVVFTLVSMKGRETKISLFDNFRTFSESFSAKRFGIDREPGNNPSGIKYLAIHSIRAGWNREFSYPQEGQGLITNPVVLTWPMSDYEMPKTFPEIPQMKDLNSFDRYDVQLSRAETYEGSTTQTYKGLRLAFFHPHKKMEPGNWFWRYRVVNAKGEQKWSQTYRFVIDKSLPVLESPTANEAYAMVPAEHPRIFRKDIKTVASDERKAMVGYLIKTADAALKKEVSDFDVKDTKPIPANAKPEEIAQINKFLEIYRLTPICTSIQSLLKAYLLDGNEKYLNKALGFGDYLLTLDPMETYKQSDFNGGRVTSVLGEIYDVAYAKLPKEKKIKYENYINISVPLILSHVIDQNIGAADGILAEHFFQFTFNELMPTAIIMKDHLPDAKVWFDLLYDIGLARMPGGGFLNDGLWPNGNVGYFQVNVESMVDIFLLYRDLFNVNVFEHPYYKACANALAYFLPPGSAGDGFGDGAEETEPKNPKRAEFAYILGQETNNPFAIKYAYKLSAQDESKPFEFGNKSFVNYQLQFKSRGIKAITPEDIPQVAVFPESGMAALHTDLMNPENNLFVSFYSSPFGTGSHAHAENNSFNIIYKGKPVFYPTGYRVTTQDKHYLLCQKHTRGKNTITVDGKTQSYATDGYGWIPRFLTGDQISYVVGDASQSYRKFHESAINWITVLNNAKSYKSENGFILNDQDDPKVKLFRRHVALLRPATVVIYDELESEKDVTWTLQLNGRERGNFSLAKENNRLIANTDNCDAAADVFASTKINVSLVDTNYVKPFDWLNPQRGRPAKTFEKNQYHTKFENVAKTNKMRFLTIIQLDGSTQMKFVSTQPAADGSISLNGYKIKAELDVAKEPRLYIGNPSSGAYLLYGPTGDAKIAGKRKFTNSTLLYEKAKGLQEAVDRYPLLVPACLIK